MRINIIFIARQWIAAVVAALFLFNSALLAQSPINAKRNKPASDLWKERQEDQRPLMAVAGIVPSAISVPLPQKKEIPDLGLGLGLNSAQKEVMGFHLPGWIASAIAPFASIQDIHFQDPSSKTVLLFQDAHLHAEAQKNIASAIKAFRRNLPVKEKGLLVGMEGAPFSAIDFSPYLAYPHRDILRRIAEGMTRARIINGVELAAITGQPGETIDVVGVERTADYENHRETLLEGRRLKNTAIKNLTRVEEVLQQLKNRHWDDEHATFDFRRVSYDEGRISLPQYVLYLDSVVTAETPESRELIEVALLEKSLHFEQVEAERAHAIKALVEIMSSQEADALVHWTALFRSGQISYSAYYERLTFLLSKNGVALSRFPELSLYIQYVLKTETIDHNRLFLEIARLEKQVEEKLPSTPEQKDILFLSRQISLLKKLIHHTLTEPEWLAYKDVNDHIQELKNRFIRLGASPSTALKNLSRSLSVFERFYDLASIRNQSMANHFATALNSQTSSFSILVAGGFHTQGLTQCLKKQRFNVIVVSPKIITLEVAPSSLDVLASGRLPLDRLLAGEKLFLPTMPATVAQPIPVRDVVIAASKAGVELERGQRSVTKQFGTVEVRVSRGEAPNASFQVEDGQGGYHVTARPVGKETVSAIFGQPFSWIGALEDVVTREFKAGREDRYQRYLLHVLGRVLDLGSDKTDFNPAKRTDFDSGNRKKIARWFNEIEQRYPAIATTLDELKRAVIRKDHENIMRLAFIVARYLADVYPHAMNRAVRWALRVGAPPLQSASVFHEVEASLERLKKEMGLHDKSIFLSMVKGRGLFKLAEIKEESFIGEDVVRYRLEMSVSFLEEYVLVDGYIQAAMTAGNLTESQARAWLIDRFMAHELAEAFLRLRSSNQSKDRLHQRAVHDILIEHGFGLTPPPHADASQNGTNPYLNSAARRLAAVIFKNPGLFQDGVRGWAKGTLKPNGVHEQDPRPPASFFGNNPFELMVYAFFDRLIKDPARSAENPRKRLSVAKENKKGYAVSHFIAVLKMEIQVLLDSRAPFALVVLEGSNRVLENLRALTSSANEMSLDQLAQKVAEASLPLFNSVEPFAERIIGEAGLWHSNKLVYESYVLQHIDSYFDSFTKNHFELTKADVVMEVFEAGAALESENVAFIQKFIGAGEKGNDLFKIRVTRQALRRIMGFKDYIYRRAFQSGVFLTDHELQKMTFDIFFAHELAEGVLDISDHELVRMGIADKERLPREPGPLEQVFITPEGLIGHLKSAPTGSRAAGKIKEKVSDPASLELVDPSLLRRQELEVLTLLEKARPILDSVFPRRTFSDAKVRFSADRASPIYNEYDKRVNLESFRKIRGSSVEKSRLKALVTPSGEEKIFRPTADIFRTVRVGEVETLTIFDQNGGLKDVADLYAKYKEDEKRKEKGSLIVGVLQTRDEFELQLKSYINFLRKKEAHDREISRAQTLLDDFINNNSSLKILTLDETAPVLKQNESNGSWDVTAFVDYFRAKALAIQPTIQFERVVFVSDWRQLVAQQIDIAVWMVMNLNMFIDLNNRIEVQSVAAIQA